MHTIAHSIPLALHTHVCVCMHVCILLYYTQSIIHTLLEYIVMQCLCNDAIHHSFCFTSIVCVCMCMYLAPRLLLAARVCVYANASNTFFSV